MNQLTLIALLHTSPQNDKEVGFNSGIITIMKMMENLTKDSSDRPEIFKLKDAIGSVVVFNLLNQSTIDELISCKANGHKLASVKAFKEATGYGLKEAKDVMDEFFLR